MNSIIRFSLLLLTTHLFARLPAGKWYTFIEEKTVMITLDSVITIESGEQHYDSSSAKMLVDVTNEAKKIDIVKVVSENPSAYRIVGKTQESGATSYMILDLIFPDTATLEVHFPKESYTSAREAELHAGDSNFAVPFRFFSANHTRYIFSLKPLVSATADEMLAAYRISTDSLRALDKRLGQAHRDPEERTVLLMAMRSRITLEELIRRGYNPFCSPQDFRARFERGEESAVDKVIEELKKPGE